MMTTEIKFAKGTVEITTKMKEMRSKLTIMQIEKLQRLRPYVPLPPSTSSDFRQAVTDEFAEKLATNRELQQKMLLYVHARRCTQPADNRYCPPNCYNMRKVFYHLLRREHNGSCKDELCKITRSLIVHWKQCKMIHCFVCKPSRQRVTGPPVQFASYADIFERNGDIKPMPARAGFEAWRDEITPGLRSDLILKLFRTMVPYGEPQAVIKLDDRVDEAVLYCQVYEREFYQIANSKLDYFQHIAEKMFQLNQDIFKRERLREKQGLKPSQLKLTLQQQDEELKQRLMNDEELVVEHEKVLQEVKPDAEKMQETMIYIQSEEMKFWFSKQRLMNFLEQTEEPEIDPTEIFCGISNPCLYKPPQEPEDFDMNMDVDADDSDL